MASEKTTHKINFQFSIQGSVSVKAYSLEEAKQIAKRGVTVYDYEVIASDDADDRISELQTEDWKINLSGKSQEASLVLRLMDTNFSFQQSIKATLVAYPDCNQKELMKELENYI